MRSFCTHQKGNFTGALEKFCEGPCIYTGAWWNSPAVHPECHNGVYGAQIAWISQWCVRCVRTHHGAIIGTSSQSSSTPRRGWSHGEIPLKPVSLNVWSCVVVERFDWWNQIFDGVINIDPGLHLDLHWEQSNLAYLLCLTKRINGTGLYCHYGQYNRPFTLETKICLDWMQTMVV